MKTKSLAMRIKQAGIMATLTASIALGGLAQAASPEGTWYVEADMGGQRVPAEIQITKEDDGYTGKLVSQQGELEVKGVKLDGNKVSFEASMDTGAEQPMKFVFDGELDGNHITGTLSSDMGEMPVVGTKAGIVGKWNVTSESQLGVMERELVVMDDMSAKYIAGDEEFKVSNLSEEDGKVTFDVTVSVQGQELPLSFEGMLEGRNLNGEYMSQGSSVATVKAAKAMPEIKKSDPTPLIGKWELEVDSPLGLLEHTLTVKEDGTAMYDQGTEQSELTDLEVVGDQVTFSTNIQGYGVNFQGTVEGGELTGNYLLDGNPVAPVTAMKAE